MQSLSLIHILEEWTHKKAVGDLARSMSLNIGKVWLKKDGQEVQVSAESIRVNDEIVIHVGNVIPFDGIVVDGDAMVNQASMTGEPLPVHKQADSYVYAGTVLEEGELCIRVRQVGGSSRYEKVVTMIEESEKLKSSLESKASHPVSYTHLYAEIPDVLFVCVKGYSIPDIIPFLREHSDAETLIVPILNIYGTGAKLQQALPDATVVDGCIYIAAEIKEPGVILQKGDIFRIVFGARKGQALCRKMFLLEQELKAAGIDAVLSDQIERDAFQKYAYVSPMAACGLYYDATAEVFQRAGEERMLLIRCMKEIDALATAMGIPFLVDIEKTNLDILDALVPEASTSMQRDIWAGKPSEIDGRCV